MKLFSLLAATMGSAISPNFLANSQAVFRGPTPSARKKGLIDKSNLPSGYPGAKLHRRAIQKGIGVKHHGLRQNGVTYKTVRGV